MDEANSTNLAARRVAWRAAFFGVLSAGLGQLYSGRPLRALILHLVSVASAFICLKALFVPVRPWNIIVAVFFCLVVWVFILVDAVRCAKSARLNYRLKTYNRWYVYVPLLLLSVAEQHAFKSIIRERAFSMPVTSMSPTILKGDYLLASMDTYAARTPQIGDIVVFRFPLKRSELFIKRIIATGGDVVKIQDEKVYINGRPMIEPHAQVELPEIPLRDNFPPKLDVPETVLVSNGFDPAWAVEMHGLIRKDGLYVPPGDYFVIGDNRCDSYDSRFWGFVPRADILGRAGVIYFSWDAATRSVRWDRMGEILR